MVASVAEPWPLGSADSMSRRKAARRSWAEELTTTQAGDRRTGYLPSSQIEFVHAGSQEEQWQVAP
jgi:hypothetical protein